MSEKTNCDQNGKDFIHTIGQLAVGGCSRARLSFILFSDLIASFLFLSSTPRIPGSQISRQLTDRTEQSIAVGLPYASRVRNYCYSAAGTRQARNVVLGLRRVCLEVRRENGGPTSGMCVCVFACARRKTKKTRTRQPSTSGFLFHRSPSSRAVSKVLV